MTLAIAGLGGYVPRYRLEREELERAWDGVRAGGIERIAVPDGDEDALTMAYEAATAALSAAGTPPEVIERVLVATTTPPLEEEGMGARLCSSLGFDAGTVQLSASTAAGVTALCTAFEGAKPTLVVASDAPSGTPESNVEHASGAGAGALVLTPTGNGTVCDWTSTTDPNPGVRFRPAGNDRTHGLGITASDRRAYRETLASVRESLEYDGDDLDAAAVNAPTVGYPSGAEAALSVPADAVKAGTVVSDVGDAGTAAPLLGLTSAVSEGASAVLVVGYGGGSDAAGCVLDCDSVPTRLRVAGTDTVSYPQYLRLRGELTPGEPDGGGAYVSLPTWRRSLPQRHRLVAGRCECGALNLPPDGACTECYELSSCEMVALAGTGTVEAATVIEAGGAPPEFLEQQARAGAFVSAIVALDGPDETDGSNRTERSGEDESVAGEDSSASGDSGADDGSDAREESAVSDGSGDGGGSDTAESSAEGDTVSLPMQVVTDDETAVSIGTRVTTTIRQIYTQEGLPRYGRKAIPVADRR